MYYLGLAGPATDGQCDITDLYTARFGQPRPGQKVFIVTCQTRNGWKARPSVFSVVVPPPTQPVEQEVTAATKVTTFCGPGDPGGTGSRRPRHLFVASRCVQGEYTGCTAGAQGAEACASGEHPVYTPGTQR